FLFLIPVISGVRNLLRQNNPNSNYTLFIIGIIAALTTSLCLLLIFPKFVSDIFYMIPQGAFGIWLIGINWRMHKFISTGLRISGIIVGIGLLLAGIFPLGFAFLVSMDSLRIPAAPIREYPQTYANNILHILLFVGSFMGILTLPFWELFFGSALLRK